MLRMRFRGQAARWHRDYAGTPDSDVPLRLQLAWFEVWRFLFRVQSEVEKVPLVQGHRRAESREPIAGVKFKVVFVREGDTVWVERVEILDF